MANRKRSKTNLPVYSRSCAEVSIILCVGASPRLGCLKSPHKLRLSRLLSALAIFAELRSELAEGQLKHTPN